MNPEIVTVPTNAHNIPLKLDCREVYDNILDLKLKRKSNEKSVSGLRLGFLHQILKGSSEVWTNMLLAVIFSEYVLSAGSSNGSRI